MHAGSVRGSRRTDRRSKKVPGEPLNDDDFTPEKQKEALDKMILELVKQGKEISTILAMPYSFLIDILREENKPERKHSLIEAFGG